MSARSFWTRVAVGWGIPFVAVLLVSSGCGREAPQKPAAPKPKPVAPVSEKAQEQLEKPTFEIHGYVYRPGDRRDPFHSLIEERKRRTVKKEHLPPLQRFSLAEMRVIGIAWSPGGYVAMLEMPDGRGYTVKVGSIVGRNKGVVKQITPKGLVVEETLSTGFGVVQKRSVTLELHTKEVIP